jgi:hypothetical protein
VVANSSGPTSNGGGILTTMSNTIMQTSQGQKISQAIDDLKNTRPQDVAKVAGNAVATGFHNITSALSSMLISKPIDPSSTPPSTSPDMSNLARFLVNGQLDELLVDLTLPEEVD